MVGGNTSGDSSYENKWNSILTYNWIEPAPTSSIRRFIHADAVAFDSVADAANADLRKNIEITTTNTDENGNAISGGGSKPAQILDMIVTGTGTYRFTGLGIETVFDPSIHNPTEEHERGQLYINDNSTVVFANAQTAGERNNFERGIILENGSLAFDKAEQLGTMYKNDPLNGGKDAVYGITVSGNNTYGTLIANKDKMILGTPINIEGAGSRIIIDTGGIDFGVDKTGAYTLTLTHSTTSGLGGKNGIYGAGMLEKTGAGTLYLADTNTYSGGTLISKGTLAIGKEDALGTGGVVINGGTLLATTVKGSDTKDYSLTSFTRNVGIGEDGGTIKVDNNLTSTFSGVMYDADPNAGDLTKTGNGTLVLTNKNNTYTGNTVIEKGTLQVNTLDGTLGPNQVGGFKKKIDVQTHGTFDVNFAKGEDETLEQQLIGDGTVTKSGAGTLTLDDENDTFEGTFSVLGGKLHLTADAKYSMLDQFNVQSGGILSGAGFLGSTSGGTIASGGTLAPGNLTEYIKKHNYVDIDTTYLSTYKVPVLTIDGPLTFKTDGEFSVTLSQYADPGNPGQFLPLSDCVVVNDLVTIEDGAKLNVRLDDWSGQLSLYDFSQSKNPDYFTIIDATGGSVADDGIKFTLNDIQLPRGVTLGQGWGLNGIDPLMYQLCFLGEPVGAFTDVARNHNQRSTGKALETMIINHDPGVKDLIDRLSGIKDDADLQDALDQLSGDLHADGAGMTLKMPWRHPFARLQTRMFTEPVQRKKRDVWAEIFGRYGRLSYDGNSLAGTTRREGVAVGTDRWVNRNLLVGTAFNYSNPQLRKASGSVQTDDYELGFYSMYRLRSGAQLKGYLGYAYQDYRQHRNVSLPATGVRFPEPLNESFQSKAHGNSLASSLELLFPIDVDLVFHYSPLMALDYEVAWQNGFSESGGITALNYGGTSVERLIFRTGVNAAYDFSYRLSLLGHLQYAHQLSNLTYARSSSQFAAAQLPNSPGMEVWETNLGHGYVNLGIGGQWFLNEKQTSLLHFGYDADFWTKMATHSGMIGFTHVW